VRVCEGDAGGGYEPDIIRRVVMLFSSLVCYRSGGDGTGGPSLPLTKFSSLAHRLSLAIREWVADAVTLL
jgi:hypothetical protein